LKKINLDIPADFHEWSIRFPNKRIIKHLISTSLVDIFDTQEERRVCLFCFIYFSFWLENQKPEPLHRTASNPLAVEEVPSCVSVESSVADQPIDLLFEEGLRKILFFLFSVFFGSQSSVRIWEIYRIFWFYTWSSLFWLCLVSVLVVCSIRCVGGSRTHIVVKLLSFFSFVGIKRCWLVSVQIWFAKTNNRTTQPLYFIRALAHAHATTPINAKPNLNTDPDLQQREGFDKYSQEQL